MYQSLELFQTAMAMARHAGSGQAVVARNIANADTPGYTGQKVPAFRDAYDSRTVESQLATRPGHMGHDPTKILSTHLANSGDEESPNGNAVSLEDEMLSSIAFSREHNRALAIYRHTMTVLRTSLGK